MKLISYFTNETIPATGLSATMDVWESDGTQVVTAQAMTEIAGGSYFYEFSGYDEDKDYFFRADGSSALDDSERYASFSNDLNQVTTATTSITADVAAVQTDVTQIDTNVTQLGVDVDTVSDLVKELRFGNQKIDFTFATSVNSTRNVAIGMLDYQTIYLKEDSASDWSSPTSTKILYFWYDSNKKLISVKESN